MMGKDPGSCEPGAYARAARSATAPADGRLRCGRRFEPGMMDAGR